MPQRQPRPPEDWIVPDWPAPAGVSALITTRNGGVSTGVWRGGAAGSGGMNLGSHCGDKPQAVAQNRSLLQQYLPVEPCWLKQVHGRNVVDLDAPDLTAVPEADAARTRRRGVICAVLMADCMPVLLCDRHATVVAAAHAGWRGLAFGVLEATIASMAVAPDQIMAFLGPAIGPQAFEVGSDVRTAFMDADPATSDAFHATRPGKWLADLPALARRKLHALGVQSVSGGDRCTVSEAEHFYSYRRDGETGRMAGMIWLQP